MKFCGNSRLPFVFKECNFEDTTIFSSYGKQYVWVTHNTQLDPSCISIPIHKRCTHSIQEDYYANGKYIKTCSCIRKCTENLCTLTSLARSELFFSIGNKQPVGTYQFANFSTVLHKPTFIVLVSPPVFRPKLKWLMETFAESYCTILSKSCK